MKLNLYTVYDNGTETYIPPFAQQTDKEAVRGFVYVLNDPQTQYGKSPSDYTLFCLGTFDPTTAKLDIYAALKNIGNGAHLKNFKEPEPQLPVVKKTLTKKGKK